jgi:hypothetical protein
VEEKIKKFFQGPGKEAVEYLGSGAHVLITTENGSYTLIVTEERDVKIGKESGDIEIKGNERMMDNLFSSSSLDDFSKKMISYIKERKGPEVKIHMDRTLENTRKFDRDYYYFLRKMVLIR